MKTLDPRTLTNLEGGTWLPGRPWGCIRGEGSILLEERTLPDGGGPSLRFWVQARGKKKPGV